jgi:hypothetical protein
MMGGAGFILLNRRLRGEERAKQVEIGLANLLKILRSMHASPAQRRKKCMRGLYLRPFPLDMAKKITPFVI